MSFQQYNLSCKTRALRVRLPPDCCTVDSYCLNSVDIVPLAAPRSVLSAVAAIAAHLLSAPPVSPPAPLLSLPPLSHLSHYLLQPQMTFFIVICRKSRKSLTPDTICHFRLGSTHTSFTSTLVWIQGINIFQPFISYVNYYAVFFTK